MEENKFQHRRWWVIAFIVSIVVNIAARLIWEKLYPAEITGDPESYLHLARNISEFGVFGQQQVHDYYLPPFWPWVLSFFVDGLMKESVFAIQTFNAILTWFVARKFLPNLWFCICILLLFTFNPSHLLISNTLGTEHIFLMLYLILILGFWFCIELFSNEKKIEKNRFAVVIAGSLFCGTVLGLTALTRGTTSVLYLLLPVLSVVFFIRSQKPLAIFLFLTAVIGFIPPLGWSIRNSKHSDHFIFIAANGPENLWIGNNLNPEAVWVPENSGYLADFEGTTLDEKVTIWNKQAISQILSHPFQAFFKSGTKFNNLYNPSLYPLEFRWDWLGTEYHRSYIVYKGLNEFLFYLVIIGIVIFFLNLKKMMQTCNKTMVLILIIAIITTTAMHCITWGLPRYRYPIEGLLWMFAVAGWISKIKFFTNNSNAHLVE